MLYHLSSDASALMVLKHLRFLLNNQCIDLRKAAHEALFYVSVHAHVCTHLQDKQCGFMMLNHRWYNHSFQNMWYWVECWAGFMLVVCFSLSGLVPLQFSWFCLSDCG